MHKFLGLLITLAFVTTARADGPPNDRGSADWSTVGAAGNRISIVRVGAGKGNEAKVSVDYKVCNISPVDGDGEKQKVVLHSGGEAEVSVSSGMCRCIPRPAGLQAVSPHGGQAPPLTGRFQIFKAGRHCARGPIASKLLINFNNRLCKELPPVSAPGLYAAWSCNVLANLPKVKRNVRLCTEGDYSVVNEKNAVLNAGNFVVSDGKFVSANLVGPEGQLREEVAVMAKGCTDYFGVKELYVLAATGGIPSKQIFLTNATLDELKTR